MGLTAKSTGANAIDNNQMLKIKKQTENDKIIGIAGNPNVGKSTVFNSLTGLNQHTGNWPGKTVTNAWGYCSSNEQNYILVDIPGTYSLMAHSAEEEVARNFICFGDTDAVIVVCDGTCLERNLNLVLQIIEMTDNVIVCVNLMDEVKRKKIIIDFDLLEKKLGVPVVGVTAKNKKKLINLTNVMDSQLYDSNKPIKIKYDSVLENAINLIEPILLKIDSIKINARWLSLKLIENDALLINEINQNLGFDLTLNNDVINALNRALNLLKENNYDIENINDKIVFSIISTAEEICSEAVTFENRNYNDRDRKLDRILTGKLTGYPIMIALLLIVFWITITGANYPSQLLSTGLHYVENYLNRLFELLNTPIWLHGMLINGIYRVLAWVVSVMLPPMMIFFPLFTLLEDLGYLPRIAFNLDKHFKKCSACGKQALTMCMGFGCNAAGIIGCRIIDSKRERLIAIITNNFVPCNGRFPMLISIITMFFVGTTVGKFSSLLSALILTLLILTGIIMTFLTSKLLSKTILKGVPSSFTLEMPPYRKPQIGKVIIRSIFDRTLFVLGRAVVVAAPAGLIIWISANVTINDVTLLSHFTDFLDPFAKLFGLDGVILMAFIFGLPANEIVVPLIIMAYMASDSILELNNLSQLKELLIANNWTFITAISTMLFSIMHWPCSTTCLTIKKETKSLKWTAVSIIVPTISGFVICFIFSNIAALFI